MTGSFFKRKLEEHEALKAEIEALQNETVGSSAESLMLSR